MDTLEQRETLDADLERPFSGAAAHLYDRERWGMGVDAMRQEQTISELPIRTFGED